VPDQEAGDGVDETGPVRAGQGEDELAVGLRSKRHEVLPMAAYYATVRLIRNMVPAGAVRGQGLAAGADAGERATLV